VIQKDERKQAALEVASFTVNRFSDQEVLTNMKGMIEYLGDWIEKKEKATHGALPRTPSAERNILSRVTPRFNC